MLPTHFIQAGRYFSFRNTLKAKDIRCDNFYTAGIFLDIDVATDIDDADIERSIKSEISLIYSSGDVQYITNTLDKQRGQSTRSVKL